MSNESRLIPLPLAEDVEIEVTSMNLAFDPSDSPYYKVVALSRVRKQYFSYTRINIYSSETKQWRISPAELLRICDHVDFRCGVFLNGAIHWPSHVGETSLYFDLENESFKTMAMPPVQGGWTRRTIRFFGEAGGRLLLIDFHEPYTETFDLFQLEDYSRWAVRHQVHLPWRFSRDRFHVLSVLRGSKEEDDDLSIVIYLPGRDKAGKRLIIYGLSKRFRLKKVHSPVLHGWDLRQFEEEGFQVVHPLIRATFAV